MADTRVRLNKDVLFDLCKFMRKTFPRGGDNHYANYTRQNIIYFPQEFIAFDDNNIRVIYHVTMRTFYDDDTDQYYLTDVDYVKFEHFLSEVPFRPKYPHFNTLVQYFRQLIDSPMIKAAK
tara:strand:- start:97 stop:459 length:363 start_codon:yes stop_codon:yes gene_type:complete